MANSESSVLTGPKVVAVTYDHLSVFEFGIVTEIFGLARPEFGANWYRFSICSADGGVIRGTGGVSINVKHGLEALDEADIIVIPGWRAPYTTLQPELRSKLLTSYERGARIIGICGGAFVLAAAGLLKGQRATTHWQFVEAFVGAYPDVRLETAPLFCADNRLYTSAGSAAGIDLCLYVVQEDFGLEMANAVAERLVVSPVRAGSQSQKIRRPILPQDKHSQFAPMMDWLRLNLTDRYTIEELATKAKMSPRTFLRNFRHVAGMNYGEWMANQRIDRAATLLLETELSIDTVAEACGYGSTGSFRRAFRSLKQVSPSVFRKHSLRQPRSGKTDPRKKML